MYDRIFELKIANAQVVINYANFLEENEYWEESFKVRSAAMARKSLCHHPQRQLGVPRANLYILLQVYERGVDLFTYPIAFEIWNTYLSKFIKRYVGHSSRQGSRRSELTDSSNISTGRIQAGASARPL